MSDPMMGESPRRRRMPPTGIGIISAAIATAMAATIASAPATFALWKDSSEVSSLTIATGSLQVAIASGTSASGTSTTASLSKIPALFPGESSKQPFTIRNYGSVAATVEAAIASTPLDFQYAIAPGDCETNTAEVSLSRQAVQIEGRLKAGSSATYCLITSMPLKAPMRAASGPFVIEFTAGSTS